MIPTIVINLKRRCDRLKLFMENWEKNHPSFFDTPIIFEAIDNKECPAHGCFSSHLQAMEYMINKNYQLFCIIEDDCVFDTTISDNLLNEIYEICKKDKIFINIGCHIFRTNNNNNISYISKHIIHCSKFEFFEDATNDKYFVEYFEGMNACIYNKNLAEEIIKKAKFLQVPSYTLPNNGYIEWILNHNMIERWLIEYFHQYMYFVVPSIIHQIGNDSDIYTWKNDKNTPHMTYYSYQKID